MADALLASDTSLQDAHSRLTELLLAAAAILAEISVPAGGKTAAGLEEGARLAGSRQKALRAESLEVPAVFEGPPLIGGKDGRHVAGHLRAAQPTSSARAGALHFAPDNRADILHNSSGARENLSDVDDDRVLQQRLPVLSAFKADGGDWGAFQRRFLAHQEMSGWSDTTALRALPAMLDDDALAAFTSAARSSRSTLQAALHLMAKVFGPPSTCRHQFYDRRKVAGETTLAYRTALLALADAAFPRMDKEGKDAMVTEQLLVLAHELGVPINVADEMEICSLAIATSIHAYEVLKRRPGVVCKWPGNAALAATIAEPQPAAVQEQAFAASRPGEWRTGGRSPTRSPRKLEQPKPMTSVVCYNCGLRGHVAAGCRAPRQRAAGPRRDDDQGHKSSQQNPASRGTSHVRSTNTAHSGRRFAGTVLAHAAPLPVEERLVAQADFTVESHPQSDEGTEWLDSLCAGSANLSGVQLGALRGLLIEFADVFSKHKYDIGCTDLLRHHIATGDAAPIRQNPFRLSPAEKEHDPKGFFGIKERTLSIGNQFDQKGQLTSRARPVGRLRSRPSGSTQGRAATNGSARLFSFWDSAEFSRLSGLDSSGSPSPLQAGKTRLTAQLGRDSPTSAESEVPLLAASVAVWRRGDDPTLHARSELWAPPTDRASKPNSPRRQRSD
ncbi:unnamed protein product [Lampetra fluviatilis]